MKFFLTRSFFIGGSMDLGYDLAERGIAAMAEENVSSMSSEVKDLLETGSLLLKHGKYEKALRHFKRACTLNPGNIKCQHWRLRAEWLINYFLDYEGKRPEPREALNTNASYPTEGWQRKTYSFKANRLWQLHYSYGFFLAQLGDLDDSANEAQWLDQNGQTEMAQHLRHHIQNLKSKPESKRKDAK